MGWAILPIMNISNPSIHGLYDTGRQGGRIRLRESHGECTLYVTPKRSRNLLNRAVEHLTGLTRTKRQNVLRALQDVCKTNGMDYNAVMRNTGLSTEDLSRVLRYRCDLKAEHLNAALSKFAQLGAEWFEIVEACGEGGYATVSAASNGKEWLALKRAKPTYEGSEPARDRAAALVEEDKVHMHAAMLHPGLESSVIQTFRIAKGADGTPYQALELAISDGEKLVGNQELAMPRADAGPASRQAFLETSAASPTLILTARDWLDGLRQTASKGIAHRDIKPANFLLTPSGRWKLTDFGTAGDAQRQFAAGERTGNDNYFAKSPEWLRSEAAGGVAHEVGHRDDVFSLGVAAYGLLAGGQRPFDFDGVAPGYTDYTNNVREYAESKLSFSDWHEAHTGRAIPKAWKPLLDGALHSDPRQRMSAAQLRRLSLFQLPDDTVKVARQKLLRSFLPEVK